MYNSDNGLATLAWRRIYGKFFVIGVVLVYHCPSVSFLIQGSQLHFLGHVVQVTPIQDTPSLD